MAAAQDDQQQDASLRLSHRVVPSGEVIVDIGGDLDIATTEIAVSYVRDVIDHYRGPVIVNLTGLEFCDARGLSALVRMANHAEQAGCPFILVSPSPPLVKLMRITGLDRRLLPFGPASRQTPRAERVLHGQSDGEPARIQPPCGGQELGILSS